MNEYARSCEFFQNGYCTKDATAEGNRSHRVDDSDASTFFCKCCIKTIPKMEPMGPISEPEIKRKVELKQLFISESQNSPDTK